MQPNTWYHLAVARDASFNETVWLNGVRATSGYNRWNNSIAYGPIFTDNRNYNGASSGINISTACGHCNQPGDRDFNGVRITNFRVVIGSTIYDPNQSTITKPSLPLINLTNTKLLLNIGNSSSLTTDSSGNQTITNTSVTFLGRDLLTPTLSWTNVTKAYGDAIFNLTPPTSDTPGTFSYSSATPAVVSLNNTYTDSATVVGPGSSVITATFSPTDTSTYSSTTTTMSITVNKATQSTLSLALSQSSKNSPYTQAISLSTTGGSGSGAITYAIAPGGTATGCALANSTETNTVTATSGGTCLIQATKSTDANYLVATSATQTFTFNAPLTLTYAVGDLGTGTAPTLSGTYFAGDTATVAAGSTLSRAGFTFNGWRNTSNTSIAAGSTFTFSTNDTLTAQWRQSSLFGISDGDLTEIQSWNASANTNSGTVSNPANTSSVTVTVPGGALPNGTTVKLWELANSNLARAKVAADKDYIVNLVLSWLKSDGTVPTASTPITIAISNNTIQSGAIAYQIIGDTVTQIGTATTAGLINLSITEDPVIVIANPVSSGGGSSGGGSSGGGSSGSGSSGGNGVPLNTVPVEVAKPIEVAQPATKLKTFKHIVTFGLSASWINSNNIKLLRTFIDNVSTSIEIKKITIQGYAQPTKNQLRNIDIARANSVAKFLKKEGVSSKFIVEGKGLAQTNKGAKSRIAVVIIEGITTT